MATMGLLLERWALLGLSTLILLALALTVSWRVGRRFRELERLGRMQAEQFAELHAEIAGIGAAVIAVGAGLDRMSGRLAIDARHSAGGSDTTARGFELAVRGARHGMSEDDLVADYGMSRQEAAFLRRLHGAPRVATRAVS